MFRRSGPQCAAAAAAGPLTRKIGVAGMQEAAAGPMRTRRMDGVAKSGDAARVQPQGPAPFKIP